MSHCCAVSSLRYDTTNGQFEIYGVCQTVTFDAAFNLVAAAQEQLSCHIRQRLWSDLRTIDGAEWPGGPT